MKKIIALLVATVMCLSFTVSVFAAYDISQDAYTIEVKVFDEEGNVITKAAPGDKVYVGACVYVTADGSDLVVAANNNAEFYYGLIVPADLATEYAGSEEASYSDVKGCQALITDAEDFKVVFVDSNTVTAGLTFSANVAPASIGLTLPEAETEYEFSIFEDYLGFDDGSSAGGAKFKIAAPTTLTVEKAAPAVEDADFSAGSTANGTDGVAITGTDKKYDNAIAVTATIVPGDATEIGMYFVPAKVNDWAKAAKATYSKALGDGNVTLIAALKNIPRALQGTAFDMLSKAYAVVNGAEQYGDILTTTINFGSTGEVE